MYKPAASQTVRASFNRAYRAPSHVNNYLDVTLANALDLGALNPALAGRTFIFPVDAIGNADLKEEKMTAYEIGYTGVIKNRATISAAFYVNDTNNSIFFTQTGSYRAGNPPPGWPLPPAVLELIFLSGRFGPGNGLPSSFSYLNFGTVRQKGIELGVEGLVTDTWTAFVNYSYQPEPEPDGFDISELNLPSQHHFNIGAGYNGPKWLGNVGVSYRARRSGRTSSTRGSTDRPRGSRCRRRPSATSGAATSWSRRSRSPTCSTRRSCSTSSAT